MSQDPDTRPIPPDAIVDATVEPSVAPAKPEPEIGGPKGPEPTRYGDWTVKGRCIDF